MAKSTPKPDNPIDALLEERARFQTWLTRLDAAGSDAPAAVRDKIRGDYQQRLDQVIEELRSHAASVAEQLATLRVREDDLATQEAAAEETLAEAELRHAVGEYEESEWERVRGGSERVLIDVREELARVSDEITRLGEVQALIAAEPEEPEAPAPAPEPEPVVEAAAEEPDGSDDWEPDIPLAEAPAPVIPSAPRFTPRTSGRTSEPAPPRTIPFPQRTEPSPDDLAFLKSMADEQPVSKRGSGSTPRVSGSGAPPAEEAPKPGAGLERPSQAATPKTLKCGECGTLNRPTEWYCERCGAELAAL
ncbi:MAG TPA: zinc finger Ran-binding domain-containing protein [Gemmatimonadales bacterium]|nr:zinc finger Ran-binding domain-containing protein [Gemmatimonadales bacterium]